MKTNLVTILLILGLGAMTVTAAWAKSSANPERKATQTSPPARDAKDDPAGEVGEEEKQRIEIKEAKLSMTMLQEWLDAKALHSEQIMPSDVKIAFAKDIRELEERHPEKDALQRGAAAPDFTLPDARGGRASLKELRSKGPVVVVFYRGEWCPYCNLTLQGYQKILPELTRRNATLVAISPQTPAASNETALKGDLEFPVLCDNGLKVSRSFGLVYSVPDRVWEFLSQVVDFKEFNGTDAHELPLTATYVIHPNGTIIYNKVTVDYKKRAEPMEVLSAIDEMS